MFEKVCSTEAFTNIRCKSFILSDRLLFIVKLNNQFFAYINQCPHRGIPLDWDNDQFLDADEELIQCSTHGALFDITTGACLSGPCTGSSLANLDLEVRANGIYVKLI